MLDLMHLASEAAEHESSFNPYIFGGIALGILLALLAITLLFGAGREHT